MYWRVAQFIHRNEANPHVQLGNILLEDANEEQGLGVQFKPEVHAAIDEYTRALKIEPESRAAQIGMKNAKAYLNENP